MSIKPLKHYSLTTPASVYDEEALTALELAGRTAAKVNEAAEAFNNLEEETNKHLVEQDAAIQKMNDEAMPAAVRDTVKQHIDNGDFDDQIDESLGNLTERVDNLVKTVPVGGTSGDAELADIRVLSDGTTAPNAGTATRQIDAAVRKYTPIVSANLFNPAAIKKGRTVGNTIDGDTEWETRDISEPIEIDIVYEITVYMNCKIESIIFYDDTGARIGGYMFEQFTPISGGYMIHYPAGKKIKYFIVQWRNEKAPDSEFYNEAENIMVSLSPISGFLPYAYDKPAYKGKVLITEDAIPDMTEGKTSLFIGANTGAHNEESEENDDGRYNTGVGVRAMQQNTTGDHNTGVGFQSLMKNTTGNYNTGFGEDTLFENTTGEHNTAVGIRAMQNNTTGSRNTVVGGGSGLNMVDGNNNTVVGQNAGNTITNEDGNTLVGQWSDIDEGVENSIAIGKSAKATKSNQTVIGTPNTTEVIVHGLEQDAGDDQTKIMSQAAVTAELGVTKKTIIGDAHYATNRFNKDAVVDGAFIEPSTGEVVNATGYFYSDLIPVEYGKTYTFDIQASEFGSNGAMIPVYNKYGDFIGRVIGTNPTTVSCTFTNTVEKGCYVRINGRSWQIAGVRFVVGDTLPSYTAYEPPYYVLQPNIKIASPENPLFGKKLAVTGDSICAGTGAVGGYAKYIAETNKMLVQNIAVPGGTITSGTTHSGGNRFWVNESVANLDADADYILIEGGVNDASLGVPMGAITGADNFTGEYDTSTYIGAFEKMCYDLVYRFAGKKYGYVAVHGCAWNYLSYRDNEYSYYYAAKKVCAKWGVPFCDLNTQVPVFGYLPEGDVLRTTYTANGDGWHPNEEGYRKYYVPKIEAWLKTL